MSNSINDHEVFWLARYAHTKLAPLIAEAQQIVPSIKFSIDLSFNNPDAAYADGHVSVFAHWDRDSMFLYSTRHRTKADIDALASKIRVDIHELRAAA